MRILPIFALILACTGDKPPGSQTPSEGEGEGEGEGEPECTADDDCGTGTICEDQVCEDGDRNNSAEEAESVLWDDQVTGVINPIGDTDFFTFTAEGGEFVRINTLLDTADRSEADDLGFDTAITLRSPSGKVVASVNDYPTGGRVNTYDAVLYAYLSEAGAYTLEVEDAASFDGSKSPQGDPAYTYTVTLAETGSHTREPDELEDPSLDVDISGANTLYAVGVVVDEDGDSDWVDLDFPYGNAGLNVYGAASAGGSDAYPELRLYTREGELLLDKVGVGVDGQAFYPMMTEAHYALELTDAYGTGGDDHWYFIFILAEDEDSAYDSEEEPNDEALTASELTQYSAETSDGDDYTYARVNGALEELGDQDWYALDGMDDGFLIICLNSSNYGSTVAPTIEVYDAGGELVDRVTGDEGASNQTTLVDNVPVVDGTYTFAVTAPGEEYGASAWYSLVAYVTSFETDNFTCP